MPKMIGYLFFSLLCVTVNLSGAILEELEGMQRIDCTLIPHKLKKSDILLEGAASNNSQWAGYVVANNLAKPQSGSVSTVSGSWTIPSLKPVEQSGVFIWMGIDGDGYSNSRGERIGTWHLINSNGSQENRACFHFRNHLNYTVKDFPISSGDDFRAILTHIGGGQFYLVFINFTKQVYFSYTDDYKTKNPDAVCKTAEWYVQKSTFSKKDTPLADFGTVSFTNCSSTINFFEERIEDADYGALTMMNSDGIAQAIPSSLNEDGNSFSVTWQHQ